MSKRDRKNEIMKDDLDRFEEGKFSSIEQYDKKLEDMKQEIKKLKKIKKRQKKLNELELEQAEILKKMKKGSKSKHR